MNNWRLLLLAVVALLHPIGSFTEGNLIDGRQECCDHLSNSLTQEARLYENSRKYTPEDRRLSSGDAREDQRRSEVRNDRINSRERLTIERTERRLSPESGARFNTEARFGRGQERRQHSGDARESRQKRENQNRKYRENISRDSLSRYERDAFGSRGIRMSRKDTRVEPVSNERVFRESSRYQDNRRVPASEDFRRVAVNREAKTHRLQRDDVNRRESRISTSQAENRLQHDNKRESCNLDRRVNENRRFRSLQLRMNSIERDHHRTGFKPISERDDVRSRDQTREPSDRTITTLRDSTVRIFAERRREVREPVDYTRRNMSEYRTKNERVEVRETPERRDREPRKNYEQRQSLSRESRMVDTNMRTERSNDRRQDTRVSRMSDETKHERRQSSFRSLDQVRSNEREFPARVPERIVRERAISYRRDLRSEERMDERREQRVLRESRDSAERRQEIRSTTSLSRFEVNARFERESWLRERDNVRSDNRQDREERIASREQTLNRMARNTQQKLDDQMSRTFRFAVRSNHIERISRIRDEQLGIRRKARDENRTRTVVMQRLASDVSTPQQKSATRRIESNTRLQRARTFENLKGERRDVTEGDEIRASRHRISASHLFGERVHGQETIRYSRIDQNEIIRNRGVLMTRRESRRQDDSRSQDRVLQRQARVIMAARSVERRSRQIRSERLSKGRDEKRTNDERDVRDTREFRAIETRRETKIMAEREDQSKRRNLAMESRAIRDDRIVKLISADIVLAKDIRADRRRDAMDTRLRNFAAQASEIEPVETSDDQNTMSWQFVVYTLQGAYLCGLLMQMMTEKSNKGRSRNITAWWTSAPKNLVKVD